MSSIVDYTQMSISVLGDVSLKLQYHQLIYETCYTILILHLSSLTHVNLYLKEMISYGLLNNCYKLDTSQIKKPL